MPTDLVLAHEAPQQRALVSEPYVSASQMTQRAQLIQQVMKSAMIEGTHYGRLPGMPRDAKPGLWKPGAEMFGVVFRIAPRFHIEDLSTPDACRYRVRCEGIYQGTGAFLGDGVGECSSDEEKYKWRKAASRSEYEQTAEDRRRIKYGYDREERKEYQIQQVRISPIDIANTVLKMAQKRAHTAMILVATAASDMFTQDLEDLSDELQQQIAAEKRGTSPVPPEKTVEQPRSKPAKAAAQPQPPQPPQPSQPSPPPAPPPANPPAAEDRSGPVMINAGQRKYVESKLLQAELPPAAIETQFGITWPNLAVDQLNPVLDWIKAATPKARS